MNTPLGRFSPDDYCDIVVFDGRAVVGALSVDGIEAHRDGPGSYTPGIRMLMIKNDVRPDGWYDSDGMMLQEYSEDFIGEYNVFDGYIDGVWNANSYARGPMCETCWLQQEYEVAGCKEAGHVAL